VALADEYAHQDLGFVNPAIYDIGRSASYHKAFHDITTGFNGYQATPGWDPVTGWGSPNAHVLIPLLARFASASNNEPNHAATRHISARRALALGRPVPRRRPEPR
jgi:hypothetical protein